MHYLISRAVLLAALSLFSLGAQASPVTSSGATFQLLYSGSPLPDSDPAHETFRITLHIDTGGVFAASGGTGLSAVAIKLSPSSTPTLWDAPGADTDWQLQSGGLNSNGCSGNGMGFQCVKWKGAGFGAPVGGVFDFVFDLTVNNGQLLTSLAADNVKVRFVNGVGSKVGDLGLSAMTLDTPPPVTTAAAAEPVPAPATAALAMLGLGAAFARRRQRVRPV